MRNNNRMWKVIAYIVVIVVLLLATIVTNQKRESTVVETVLSYTVMPIQRGLSYVVDWVSGYRELFPQIDDLKKENEELKKENEEIKKEFVDYELVLEENRMLKEQMNLTQKYPEFKTLSGVIMAEDTSNWYQLLVVSQGKKDGVKEGMTVVSDKGLIGYVKEVNEEICKVMTIVDPGNSISGRVTKTKEAVVCRGELGLKDKSQMKLIYIPTEIVLSEGDIVETSGLGGLYKKGIEIGEIVKVVEAANTLESYAIVETAVDFSTLEYVLIILE